MNIKAGIDYLSEGIALLTCLGKDQPLKKYIDNYLYEASLDKKAFYEERKEALDFLFQLEKEAQKEFKKDQDLIASYFGSSYEDEKTDCIGRIILLWEEYDHVAFLSSDEYKEKLLSMDEDEYYKCFFSKIQFFNDTFRNYDQASQPSDCKAVLTAILNSDFKENQKLCFTEAVINHTEHLQKIFTLIEKAILLLKKHEDEILSLYAMFSDYWENALNGADPIEYFSKGNGELRSMICGNPLGHIVTIELFHPLMKGFNVETDKGTFLSPIVMPIGILYCNACPLDYSSKEKSSIDTTAFYLSVLKQISHIRRFEILSYVRDKEAYGNELAEYLGLTNATVSHHTSLLYGTELIKINHTGTQVLYSSNKKTIENCLDFLRKELL